MIKTTKFMPNTGILIPNEDSCQWASCVANGYFTGKSDLSTLIRVFNRHDIDLSWEKNNIYFIYADMVYKSTFDGQVLASRGFDNPKSLCVLQRRVIPDNPDDYEDPEGCIVAEMIGGKFDVTYLDADLNFVDKYTLTQSISYGNKVHIISYGPTNYHKFALSYINSFGSWNIDLFDTSIGLTPIAYYYDLISSDYSLNANNPAFLTGDGYKFWALLNRNESPQFLSREKIYLFGDNSNTILKKIIDPLSDLGYNNSSVIIDMAINFTVPNQIIVLGGYSGTAWLATYSTEGNLLTYLKNIPILQPHAIKIVQNPTSSSFYITAE